MAAPTLIYCAGGNRRYAEIAINSGFQYGARLPDTIYFPVYFADQDWRSPNREAYMAALAQYRPTMATVVDWEKDSQLPHVLDWAHEASQYVERVLIVPKVIGGIARLPRRINGAEVVLAYSVPTKYAGTQVPSWEFHGWPVHLLGGSPHRQMELAHYMNVVSADGNMTSKMASERCCFWRKEKGKYGHWVLLSETGDEDWGKDSNYEAFRRSCENIAEAWASGWGL